MLRRLAASVLLALALGGCEGGKVSGFGQDDVQALLTGSGSRAIARGSRSTLCLIDRLPGEVLRGHGGAGVERGGWLAVIEAGTLGLVAAGDPVTVADLGHMIVRRVEPMPDKTLTRLHLMWGVLDSIPPGTPTFDTGPPNYNTAAYFGPAPGHFTFRWTAAGDDGMTGTAAFYEIRKRATPFLTEADWDAATALVPWAVNVVPGGTATTYDGSGSYPTVIYVAVRYKDEQGNVGPFLYSLVFPFSTNPPPPEG